MIKAKSEEGEKAKKEDAAAKDVPLDYVKNDSCSEEYAKSAQTDDIENGACDRNDAVVAILMYRIYPSPPGFGFYSCVSRREIYAQCGTKMPVMPNFRYHKYVHPAPIPMGSGPSRHPVPELMTLAYSVYGDSLDELFERGYSRAIPTASTMADAIDKADFAEPTLRHMPSGPCWELASDMAWEYLNYGIHNESIVKTLDQEAQNPTVLQKLLVLVRIQTSLLMNLARILRN